MDFLDIRNEFEKQMLGWGMAFELQELRYMPNWMGSGLMAYTIGGRQFKISYDRRETYLAISASKWHEKYSGTTWKEIGSRYLDEFLKDGAAFIQQQIS